MTVIELELKRIVDRLDTISSSCYNEDVDPVFIGEQLDFIIDDINNLIEFTKRLEKSKKKLNKRG